MSVLEVRGLTVTGPAGVIVSGVDLHLEAGATVAIVGESGSGKSMTAKAITGLLPRGVTATGSVRFGDTEVQLDQGPGPFDALRGTRISLLLQNPFTSLSPVHRCGDQIAATLAGRPPATHPEVLRRLDEVDLPARVATQHPFELSGGMRQRVALAASLASDPQVLIGDEPTTALDVTTQRDVLDLLARIQRERTMALLLITHDLGVARERADRIIVMYAGRFVEEGPGGEVFTTPSHPYTAGLRDSEPPLEVRLERLAAIPGSVPHAGEVPPGCAFAPRCHLATDDCRSAVPVLAPTRASTGASTNDGDVSRRVACIHPLGADDASGVTRVAAEGGADGDAGGAARPGLLLEVRGLTRRFRPEQPPALDGVSIEVGAGEAVGVVGESGSGKTTLARCLVGLERADSGEVCWHVDGAGSRVGGAAARGGHVAQRAQIVFQDPASALNPRMTVGTALAEALRAGGRPRSEVAELLGLVGLPTEYAARRPAALSGGEQQRVAIARALAPRPQLLICDEPVSSLDVSVQAQILNLLNTLRERLGLALLFITHDLAVVRQVVTRVYVMQNGEVVEAGAMDALVAAPAHDYTRRLFASVPGR
jgi:peptide/nickel transport system ATP-binding protein